MLLPSALTCDSSTPKTRYQSAALFASPPLSPAPSPSSSSHPAFSNIYSTCRALQSMLTTPSQLPSPPTTYAEVPPPSSSACPSFKLRLRAHKADDATSSSAPNSNFTTRKKIIKRTNVHTQPPRGINKRRRVFDDEMGREAGEHTSSAEDSDDENMALPSTPKRMRFAPEVLPLGLERADFHTLNLQRKISEGEGELHEGSVEEGGRVDEQEQEWSTEDDRLLVELVLEKLKLTKSDWQDCARSLGKDRGSVGRRWKSLMGGGEVGLKNRPRRARIHSTWR